MNENDMKGRSIMKRLIIMLMIGLCLTACSTNTETSTTTENNTTQNSTTDTTTEDKEVKYVTDLGFTDVTNVNGTQYYQTYTLDNATATQSDVYNQWLYTWVEPSEYVGKTIDVYQYTGMKDNKDYDIYVLMSGDKQIGGYYYEKGKDISSASILDNSTTARIASDRICLPSRRPGFHLWVRKILWRRKWQ